MLYYRMLFAAVLLLTLCLVLHAYPSLSGASGLVTLPTARVVPASQCEIAIDGGAGLDVELASSYRANYGLGGTAEIGVAFTDVEAEAASWIVHVKQDIHIAGRSKVAVGALYHQRDKGDKTAVQAYFVGTKVLAFDKDESRRLVTSLGITWTQQTRGGSDTTAIRPYGGLELFLAKRVSLLAEMQAATPSLDENPLVSAALRFPIAKHFAGQVGVTNTSYFAGDYFYSGFLGIAYVVDDATICVPGQ